MKNIVKPIRILSIDIMRGMTLILMLFVNDLYTPGVPAWFVHTTMDVDGMGLADWVFPGFLFMVGMSIPYAMASRRKKGDEDRQLFKHIIVRTLSLLLIGVLIMNIGRLNAGLTGVDRNVWAICLYISVFFVWNAYPIQKLNSRLHQGFRIMGIAGLCLLMIVFRAGERESVTWLETGWWGILGLIGWGYFVAAVTYLFLGFNWKAVLLLWIAFIMLNMADQLGWMHGLDFLYPFLGVLISGNIPSIVVAGLMVGMLLHQSAGVAVRKALIIAVLGVACILLGLFLRNWFIISKIRGTPSWAMICNGLSMMVYSVIYFLVDIKGKYKWAVLFNEAGRNSLTTYLAPDVIYFLCWGLGIPLFFYKQETSALLAVSGSIIWAFAMIGFANLLSKMGIRLKL